MNIIQIKKIVKQMAKKKDFRPILEADVSAFFYHNLIRTGIPVNKLHLDTRIIGSEKNRRFDVVVGQIDYQTNSKPAIRPKVVVEIKIFPAGFTDQQHRVHFISILTNDLPKLGSLTAKGVLRIELLWDAEDYLSGLYIKRSRLEVIRKTRDSVARGVHMIRVNIKNKNPLTLF